MEAVQEQTNEMSNRMSIKSQKLKAENFKSWEDIKENKEGKVPIRSVIKQLISTSLNIIFMENNQMNWKVSEKRGIRNNDNGWLSIKWRENRIEL